MISLVRQSAAIAAIKLAGVRNRVLLTMVAVLAISLVVIVLLGLLAMREGFREALAAAGSTDVAVLTRAGSQSEINSVVTPEQVRIISDAPGIARDTTGAPMISPELYIIVSKRRTDTGEATNLALRGMSAAGLALRPQARLVDGRQPNAGAQEIMIGETLVGKIEGFGLGGTLRLGRADWKIVGIFSAGGGVLESEIWADASAIQQQFRRSAAFQSIRVRLDGPGGLDRLKTAVAADPRLLFDVATERAFFASQAEQTSDLIQKLGWPLGVLMAIGAVAAALGAMQASADAHAGDILTLRAIGFTKIPTFLGSMIEATLVSASGVGIGVVLSIMLLHGLTASTLSTGLTQIAFKFRIDSQIALQASILALVAGLIGGVLPAWQMARSPLVGNDHR